LEPTGNNQLLTRPGAYPKGEHLQGTNTLAYLAKLLFNKERIFIGFEYRPGRLFSQGKFFVTL
jgi:hypothetical protein